jgi:hypothetical protein
MDPGCRPGQALFLTDAAVRREAEEPPPLPDEELLCDLTDERQVLEALVRHLEKWQLTLDGVVCYDCESMALAARLAGAYGLPTPVFRRSPTAVTNSGPSPLAKPGLEHPPRARSDRLPMPFGFSGKRADPVC